MTIAVGVKRSARDPRGPERERARYRTRPTTTGGNPKKALIKSDDKTAARERTYRENRSYRQADHRRDGGRRQADADRKRDDLDEVLKIANSGDDTSDALLDHTRRIVDSPRR
jgi:hypothetical protein